MATGRKRRSLKAQYASGVRDKRFVFPALSRPSEVSPLKGKRKQFVSYLFLLDIIAGI